MEELQKILQEEDVPVKKTRKSFKSLFTPQQLQGLEEYFTKINILPRRKERHELAQRLSIEPVKVAKWFQSRRTKERTTIKKARANNQKVIIIDERLDKPRIKRE